MKVLIVATSGDMRDKLIKMTEKAYPFKDIVLADSSNAREIAKSDEFGLVMLILPLENEFGLALADEISKTTKAVMMLFVPTKNYDEVCHRIKDKRFFIHPKNIVESAVISAISTATAYSEMMYTLRKNNEELEQTLNDTKLVNRAKCVLIEYLRITEKEAHRQIQKRAMDQRVPITQIANDILKTYEYLNIDKG